MEGVCTRAVPGRESEERRAVYWASRFGLSEAWVPWPRRSLGFRAVVPGMASAFTLGTG